MKRTTSPLLGLVLASALALTGCTSASDIEGNAAASGAASIPAYDTSAITTQEEIAALLPESVAGDGKLTVGASTDYPPAEFRNGQGTPVGYDVDLTKAIAAVLGLEAVTEHAEFDSIIPAVGSTYDLGISSFTITAERMEAATMVSYINVGSQFNVPRGNPEGIDPSNPLNLCGLTIGVQTGTAQADALDAYSADCVAAGKPAISSKSYTKNTDATNALAGNTLDAVFADATVAGYAQIQTNGGVEVVGEVIDAAPQGIVVAKGDDATAQAVQQAVQYLMDNGHWTAILETWSIDTSQALTTAEINPAV
ncbi:ABC transporter substrate-binding protein [Actinomyces howellii]|uniref:Glutamine-binding periplasmic protein n=1 Tax=Actinomyces howellii TaxID=52771 RepID=A0A3S4SLC9_9ACTO|nr:ABC transporter substrate-binding protein [Actinomyces howellii]VEG25825.1 Glutamine-binding periplasmic protein precursor [Actinomyces howellii]